MTEKDKGWEGLLNGWLAFSGEMAKWARVAVKGESKGASEVYWTWMDHFTHLSRHLSEALAGDDEALRRAQAAWDECAKDMNKCFQGMLESDEGAHRDLYESWTRFSETMGEHMTDQVVEQLKASQDMTRMWFDSLELGEDDGQKTMDLASVMQRHWMGSYQELWRDTLDIMGEGTEPQDVHRKLYDVWANSSRRMWNDVMSTPEFGKWLGEVRDANLDAFERFRKANEEMLQYLGSPTRTDVDEIHRALKELSMDVKELRTEMDRMERGRGS